MEGGLQEWSISDLNVFLTWLQRPHGHHDNPYDLVLFALPPFFLLGEEDVFNGLGWQLQVCDGALFMITSLYTLEKKVTMLATFHLDTHYIKEFYLSSQDI